MRNVVILENIRSAYNVGNIIRTADALEYNVVLSGFSPTPFSDDEKVSKTSLGAEENVNIQEFWNPMEALKKIKSEGYVMIAAEIVEGESIDLTKIPHQFKRNGINKIALIFGNENTGVLRETLEYVDYIVHIPMQGVKRSLNVGQAAAIFMWEFLQKEKHVGIPTCQRD